MPHGKGKQAETTTTTTTTAAGPAAAAAAAVVPAGILDEADQLKEKGNLLFKQHHFPAAIDAYSAALALRPTAALYGNRAFAYIKTERTERGP